MERKLFCEISPLTYKISRSKEIMKKHLSNILSRKRFAVLKSDELLPIIIKKHKSLIRRKLNNVDLELQNNKAKNLSLAAPKINKVLIRPGETFSFWRLVGDCTKAKGYLDGMTISKGKPDKGTGGGMCQFTNLLHWMILHTDLTIVEHHHHNRFDLFPDFKRQIPFGTGTSIVYNNLDYQVTNNTEKIYQIIVYTTEEHLCGEIRSDRPLEIKVHIAEEESYFIEKTDGIYRHNKIYREVYDKKTGDMTERKMLLENNSKVMYDRSFIDQAKIKKDFI